MLKLTLIFLWAGACQAAGLAVSQVVAPMAPVHFSAAQSRALVNAYRVGQRYGLGIVLAAIVWQESSACERLIGDDGAGLGCAQMHLSAARHVTGTKVSAWALIHDRRLALRLAARFLQECVSRYGLEGGIGCYHLGLARARALPRPALAQSPYVLQVLAKVRVLERLHVSRD